MSCQLTDRQREVLNLRCRDGLLMKETAAAMGIAIHTVKDYSTLIVRRMGARSFAQACFLCGRAMSDPEPPGARSESV